MLWMYVMAYKVRGCIVWLSSGVVTVKTFQNRNGMDGIFFFHGTGRCGKI